MQAAKTPASAVAVIMQEAQNCEMGDPNTLCNNPFFEGTGLLRPGPPPPPPFSPTTTNTTTTHGNDPSRRTLC